MKKSIIAASAASVALAAMPIVGVFAADVPSVTDTIQVTVGSSCTFDAVENVGKTYTASMSANELKTLEGATTLKVTCNNTSGYTVYGTFQDLAGQTSGNTEKITFSTSAPTAGSGTWAAKLTATSIGSQDNTPNTFLTSGNAVITSTAQSGTSSRAYDSATIQYSVSTGSQKADTYKGTAVYTFTNS